MKVSEDILFFFRQQNFTIVSTIGKDGQVHNSCKGIVKISEDGLVYLLDLYKADTFLNLQQNHNISVTAVDEHKFKGYCLKGTARIEEADKFSPDLIKEWEQRISGRITQRVLKNIKEEKGHLRHPESQFPKPAYLIVMEVNVVVDLTPHILK